jgi:ABC-2 type transport system ATP-binding protein
MSGAVTLQSLVKSFRGTDGPVRAVRGMDLSVERGETAALLGPNGAGKSTTLDILLGLTEPDAGAVSIFGSGPHEAIAAGEVGAMLQTGALIHDLSVRELVSMMASLYPQPFDVGHVLELTGLQTLADKRTQKLSGGQAQRVRLALALVSDPDLLVLDEPTVSLDVGARRDFWATMRSFAASGKTVIFATHYLEEADAYADRVVLMAHGQVVADGPTTEIKAMVGARTIRATLPAVSTDRLGSLPGVTSAERHGETVILACSNSDVAIRALLERYPGAEDIEITGAGLEQAFLALTSDDSGQSLDEEVFAA